METAKAGNFFGKLIFPTLILCGFCIALPPFFKSLSLALLVLVLLLSGELLRFKVSKKQILKWNNPVLWLVGLYLLYVLGMLWSSDLSYGFNDLGVKFPLLLVPFLFCFVPKRCLTKRKLWIYAFAFVGGLLIVLFSCLIRGLANGISDNGFDSRQIFYTRLAGKYHATYLSLFTCLGLVLTYKIPLGRMFRLSTKLTFALKALVFLILVCFVGLLSTRIALPAMAIVFAAIVLDIWHSKSKILKSVLFIAFSVLVFVAIFNLEGYTKRYNNVIKNIDIENTEGNRKYSDSVSQRTFIFSNISELILRQPLLGYGTGDSRNALESFYLEKKVDFGRYLNAHNQFFQTAISTGVAGLLCLLAMFLCFALRLWGKGKWVYLSAIIAIGFFCLTESILERQAGVHFCAFAFLWLNAMGCCKNKKKGLA